MACFPHFEDEKKEINAKYLYIVLSINEPIYFENIHFVYIIIIVNPPLPEKRHQYTRIKTTCHKS